MLIIIILIKLIINIIYEKKSLGKLPTDLDPYIITYGFGSVGLRKNL